MKQVREIQKQVYTVLYVYVIIDLSVFFLLPSYFFTSLIVMA